MASEGALEDDNRPTFGDNELPDKDHEAETKIETGVNIKSEPSKKTSVSGSHMQGKPQSSSSVLDPA
jgi:hypothetical protein